MYFIDNIGAFALLDKTYKDEVISATILKEEETVKQKLADQVLPIDTVTTRKEMTVVGWSPNLLQNASGEVCLINTFVAIIAILTLQHVTRKEIRTIIDNAIA